MNREVANERKWNAVMRRDAAYDLRFVYAVKTTGIYCKPSCSARRPHKENTLFFASARAAAAAGYRECAKCRAASAPEDLRAVQRALDYLESRLHERVSLSTLAAHVGLSPFHFHRMFKRRVGVSPRIYVATRRAERLKRRLREANSVADASLSAGYADERAAYGDAFRALGMTPGAYRRRGAGKLIAYTTAKTGLGRALVAATTRGVAAIYFGDSVDELERELRAEYPEASIAPYSAKLGAEFKAQLSTGVQTVRTQLRGQKSDGISLDVEGTPFQSKVWQALKEIPIGKTRSYNEVARLIGLPGSSRAVARACAANKVALVIPCHRVIRSDGQIASYRWGAQRKKTLLEAEKAS